ncbi:CRISPR-associated protein Cas5, subtype I-B/TNEAP [Marinitoga piezophila KA3]|uniref:CRISPR-associated protein Cas5, subtype I-B/TNEAP n=1 Tax=Marinitoga piezophila (strain DSM 14283 / JCM 11233 / KA3) TaxID=443254 RepID=H2J3Z9_MARPK|nr:type I-B CRISPR-associated protein Cas5b [Marinitoga piezophila]AEX84727.1 CRISPR-associated protein Cas5, subtype I-B/TNEAP [Marinitoga piezophila KA3]
MKVYRIYISSWTASFRYPNLISGFQPTLLVPPFSTINGLISSAKGDYFIPQKEKIGYVFRAKSKNIDLETIYQMEKSLKNIKSNVIKREFLVEAELFLYTDSKVIAGYFLKPKYQLLLGRSSDLATVKNIDEIEIEEKNNLKNLKGTIIPLKYGIMPGVIHALPKYFSNTIPRKNIGTQPYCILDWNYKQEEITIHALGFSDYDKKLKIDWDVYWQEP